MSQLVQPTSPYHPTTARLVDYLQNETAFVKMDNLNNLSGILVPLQPAQSIRRKFLA